MVVALGRAAGEDPAVGVPVGDPEAEPVQVELGRLPGVVDTLPNVVGIKAEQGYPQPIGIVEMMHHFKDDIVVNHPIENQCLPLMDVMDIRFSGTSNTQWMSDYYPKAFQMARNGQWEQAMESFWATMPARLANDAVGASYMPGTSTLNRTSWKYQDWLAGFNGGALRHPMTRLPDRHMKALRAGLWPPGCRAPTIPTRPSWPVASRRE